MFPASGNTISLSAGPPGREKERNFRLSFVSLCEKLIDRIFIDARNVLVHYSMNAKNILFINYQQSFPESVFCMESHVLPKRRAARQGKGAKL